MSAQSQVRITPEEYLVIERAAEFKSGYFDGHMFAMSGGSPAHSLIASNLIREFGNALKGKPCLVYTSDLRLGVKPKGLYTYPDLSIVCGEMTFVDKQQDTATNPTLLIEVLSPSTEKYDRTFKLEQYKTIESLREYALVSQNRALVEVYRRDAANNWAAFDFQDLDATCRFDSVSCDISMSEIYYQVNFEE